MSKIELKALFLQNMKESGLESITHLCKMTSVNYSTVIGWRQKDYKFKGEYDRLLAENQALNIERLQSGSIGLYSNILDMLDIDSQQKPSEAMYRLGVDVAKTILTTTRREFRPKNDLNFEGSVNHTFKDVPKEVLEEMIRETSLEIARYEGTDDE